METNDKIKNGMVVFDRPIIIERNYIYGLIYNKEVEYDVYLSGGKSLDYLTYLIAVEQFLKNGGEISDDGGTWTFPGGQYTIKLNDAVKYIFRYTIPDTVGIRRIEFEEPIVWNEDEVDKEDNALIVNYDLIERYDNNQLADEDDLPF